MWKWQQRIEMKPSGLFVLYTLCHMCSRAGNWQCCVRFGITADLPSVTKAATTDWTAKWSDWEKPTILLFCLFPTVNVFWFWKSMCDCNIFYCTTALKCDSFVVICSEYALLNHMRLPKIPVLNIVGTDSTSQTIILFRESLDSGGRRPVWLHHRCRLCFVNANISCVGLNRKSKRWVTVPIKK